MFKKFCILCCDEGVHQGFWQPFIRDGDSVAQKEFSYDLVFFGVYGRVGIERRVLQRFEIRKLMGVVEKKEGSAQYEEESREDKGIEEVIRPPLLTSLSCQLILSFHGIEMREESEKGKPRDRVLPFLFCAQSGLLFLLA
jgi:hypothetical protein